MENIDFSYSGSRRKALDAIDAVVHRGEFVGIVGPSGAGKSTLMDVILGLLVPTDGRLLVDGEDISRSPRRWQNNIGYVPQTIFLIDDSLRRNVALGIADDVIDDDRVLKALRMASLDSVVAELPQGLDTPLGEQGMRLSGGQCQRVGIARALYHDPDVLVLDEATADLDSETEHAVTQTLRSLKGQKTIIVIAHRLSTVKDCDSLLFMKNARIVDRGTLDELRRRNQEFDRLARLSDLSTGNREILKRA